MSPSFNADAVTAAAAYRTLYPRLYDLALAIQHYEGFKPGSRSFRNNNPGNMRSSPLGTTTADNFAVFPDYFTGLVALMRDLWGKCSGHTSTGLDGKSTLADLVATWAPPVENQTRAYLAYVAAELKVPPDTKLASFLSW